MHMCMELDLDLKAADLLHKADISLSSPSGGTQLIVELSGEPLNMAFVVGRCKDLAASPEFCRVPESKQ